MKKLKSLGIIALCICIIGSAFAGCSQTVSLEGTWKTTIDLDALVQELDLSEDEDSGKYFEKFDAPLSADLIYVFDSDNAYTTSVDEEKFKADFDAFCEKYYDYVMEGTYKMGEDSGMTREDMDKYYESEYGKSMREALVADLKMDEIYNEFVDECNSPEKQPTLIEGNKAYITDEQGNKTGYETFTLEGDTYTITGEFDIDGNPIKDNENITYPMVFTKQAETTSEQ